MAQLGLMDLRIGNLTHPMIKLAPRLEPVAARETQPAAVIHPVKYASPLRYDGGARRSVGKDVSKHAPL